MIIYDKKYIIYLKLIWIPKCHEGIWGFPWYFRWVSTRIWHGFLTYFFKVKCRASGLQWPQRWGGFSTKKYQKNPGFSLFLVQFFLLWHIFWINYEWITFCLGNLVFDDFDVQFFWASCLKLLTFEAGSSEARRCFCRNQPFQGSYIYLKVKIDGTDTKRWVFGFFGCFYKPNMLGLCHLLSNYCMRVDLNLDHIHFFV